jgi:hypothetical protein
VLLFALSATALSAAVIRGTIVENRTGKPLSRVSVVLAPIAGTKGSQATARTNNFGGFEFQSLAGGSYLLKASRRGFLPLEYGQKLWNSAGQPIVLADEASAFLNIRLMRYGGITGAILDENDIGLSEHEVVAYRNTVPPQVAARGKSDDRGMYRLSGLEPGVYVVRTAGTQDEQISYIPTFSKETLEREAARTVQVFLDEDAAGMDIRPAHGRLFTISVNVDVTPPCPSYVNITLASDLGRRTVKVPCYFQFGSLPPGAYEVYAEFPEVPGWGAYAAVSLAGDVSVTLKLPPLPPGPGPTRFDIAPLPAGGSNSMQIAARRKDLAGVGPATALQLANNSAMLAPGRWEVMLTPTPGYYVSGFYGPGFGRSRTRPDGWNEFFANNGTGWVRFTLSGGPGEIHGVVKSYSDPVVGAPVYLEGYDPETRKRVADLLEVRTDNHGLYRFQGLAPGIYRVLSTFEYQRPDSAAMELAAAPSVRVEARSELQMDLDLYGIR